MRLNVVLLMALSSLLLACSPLPERHSLNSQETYPGQLLIFSEQTDKDTTAEIRLLFTDRFLRVDDSRLAKGDFLLYDHERQKLFKVDSGRQAIQVIGRAPLPLPPQDLDWQHISSPSQALIRSGRESVKAIHYKFLLNGEPCYNIVALQGRLEVARDLLQAYRELSAGNNSVGDSASLCDNAVNIYQPDKVLQFGFPIREWSATGYRRFLEDFRPGLEVRAELFSLPDGYRFWSADERD